MYFICASYIRATNQLLKNFFFIANAQMEIPQKLLDFWLYGKDWVLEVGVIASALLRSTGAGW